MKKILLLLLALTMTFALAACGNQDKGPDEEGNGDQVIITPDDAPDNGLPGGGEGDKPDGKPSQPAGGSASAPSGGGTATSKPPSGNAGSNKPADKGDLTSLMDQLVDGKTGEMSVLTEEIAPDAFQANLFIDYIEGAKAVSSSAMMSSIAHSICLLQLPDGTDAAKVAEQINTNKDPRKWICVEAEKAVVLQRGNYILLAMSETSIVDSVTENFKASF